MVNSSDDFYIRKKANFILDSKNSATCDSNEFDLIMGVFNNEGKKKFHVVLKKA